MSGWGCPHYKEGKCSKIKDKNCDPGMKGCVLAGKYAFADDTKNIGKAKRALKKREEG